MFNRICGECYKYFTTNQEDAIECQSCVLIDELKTENRKLKIQLAAETKPNKRLINHFELFLTSDTAFKIYAIHIYETTECFEVHILSDAESTCVTQTVDEDWANKVFNSIKQSYLSFNQ